MLPQPNPGRPARLREQVEQGQVTLRVAATFTPHEIADAHRRLEAGGTRGRLVIASDEAGAGQHSR